MTSRPDIPVITESFRTSTGTDAMMPQLTDLRHHAQDSENLVFVFQFEEAIKMMELKIVDTVTQETKKLYFFDLAGGAYYEFLVRDLVASRIYNVSFFVFDMSGNVITYPTYDTSTAMAEDETVPEITERIILERTSTTATVRLVSNELLRKLTLQYRIPGTEEWWEEAMLETQSTYQTSLTNLQSGQAYEYRLVLEDLSGNQLVTSWEGV